MLQNLPVGGSVNHHFRNRVLSGSFLSLPVRDQAKTFVHVSS